MATVQVQKRLDPVELPSAHCPAMMMAIQNLLMVHNLVRVPL